MDQTALLKLAELLPKVRTKLQLSVALALAAIIGLGYFSGRFPAGGVQFWIVAGAIVVSFVVFPESFRIIPQIPIERRPSFILALFFGFLVWLLALILVLSYVTPKPQPDTRDPRIAELETTIVSSLDLYPGAALDRANELVAVAPDRANAYLLRGFAHWGLGDCNASLQDYEQGLKFAAPEEVKFSLSSNEASSLICLGYYDEAQKILVKLLEERPTYQPNQIRMGLVYTFAKDPKVVEKGREQFARVAANGETDVSKAFSYIAMGLSYITPDGKTDDENLAIKNFWAAVCADPQVVSFFQTTDSRFVYRRYNFTLFLPKIANLKTASTSYRSFLKEIGEGHRRCGTTI